MAKSVPRAHTHTHAAQCVFRARVHTHTQSLSLSLGIASLLPHVPATERVEGRRAASLSADAREDYAIVMGIVASRDVTRQNFSARIYTRCSSNSSC